MTARERRAPTRRLAIDDGGYAKLARQIPSPNHDARPRRDARSRSSSSRHFAAAGRVRRRRRSSGCSPIASTPQPTRTTRRSRTCTCPRIFSFAATARCSSSCPAPSAHGMPASRRWRGRERCNDFSIGIELEGTDDVPYAARAVRDAGAARSGAARGAIRSQHIVGHRDIAPGRKTDPGPGIRLGPAAPPDGPPQLTGARPRAARTAARPGGTSPRGRRPGYNGWLCSFLRTISRSSSFSSRSSGRASMSPPASRSWRRSSRSRGCAGSAAAWPPCTGCRSRSSWYSAARR